MRTRIHKWLDLSVLRKKRVTNVRGEILYGVQVQVNGKWLHAHRNGKPLIYKTIEKAEAQRTKLLAD